MAYIRKKRIKGHLYYYEESQKWINGKHVTQHVRYIGKSLQTLTGTPGQKQANRLNIHNQGGVPQKTGVLFLYNRRGTLIYIKSAENLRSQINELGTEVKTSYYFRWIGTKTLTDADIMALEDINKYNPKYNRAAK